MFATLMDIMTFLRRRDSRSAAMLAMVLQRYMSHADTRQVAEYYDAATWPANWPKKPEIAYCAICDGWHVMSTDAEPVVLDKSGAWTKQYYGQPMPETVFASSDDAKAAMEKAWHETAKEGENHD